jgi:hypothetical protein
MMRKIAKQVAIPGNYVVGHPSLGVKWPMPNIVKSSKDKIVVLVIALTVFRYLDVDRNVTDHDSG